MKVLLNDGSAMIDSPADGDLATSCKWSNRGGYAVTNYRIGGRKGIQKKRTFHRLVMERVVGRPLLHLEQVDHANRNALDNRRENLRIATHGQNLANRRYDSSTGYRGVYQPPASFIAAIKSEHTRIYIGSFQTVEEAAWMYDQFASQLHGEFASLNFEYT